ncbi:MAG: baseplate J/gp47 family protein [Dysgonamonadaceae bacterium]|jgi:phage-related baseplate assembly protein|nr:baseplate J/gp47 family protein [Dysgonamonadaceae bacterium]
MASEVPQFIERDPDVIMSESKAQLEAFLGRELQPAQVEQLMLQFIVYREILLLNRFNAGMSQMLYQFSQAPILDYIAGLVAVERLSAASAGCTVCFTLVPGHGNVLIPEGTRVATSDSEVIFMVADDYILSKETESIDIPVLAEIPGKSGNGYLQGEVNKILDPLAFVSTVTNTDVTSGGSDEETDEQLQERIRLAPSQYSSAGSRQSYLFYAKSANPAIKDVSVSSPIPGTVLIVPLADENEISQKIFTDIYNACNAENVRPLTDTVIVAAPEQRDYAIEVNLVLFDNADASDVRDEISAILDVYAQENRKRLGVDIVRSHINKICRLDSVYDVEVVSPSENVVIGEGEFACCTQITVNVTGFNHG